MKRITHSLPILALVVFVALETGIVATLSAGKRVEPPDVGLERYIPTKLEWLALSLQAHDGFNFLETQGVRIAFIPEAPDTILILLQHTPSASREVMNIYMDAARKVIGLEAEGHKWDGWVRIREKVSLVKPASQAR